MMDPLPNGTSCAYPTNDVVDDTELYTLVGSMCMVSIDGTDVCNGEWLCITQPTPSSTELAPQWPSERGHTPTVSGTAGVLDKPTQECTVTCDERHLGQSQQKHLQQFHSSCDAPWKLPEHVIWLAQSTCTTSWEGNVFEAMKIIPSRYKTPFRYQPGTITALTTRAYAPGVDFYVLLCSTDASKLSIFEEYISNCCRLCIGPDACRAGTGSMFTSEQRCLGMFFTVVAVQPLVRKHDMLAELRLGC